MLIANERREEERRGAYYNIDYYVPPDQSKSSSHIHTGLVSRFLFYISNSLFLSFLFTKSLFGDKS